MTSDASCFLWCFGRRNLKKMMKMGYEVYSGTIVGLPFQTDENLVEDILGMKELGVDGLE